MDNNRPIGVFDSGLGGISVLNACRSLLKHEHFIYFGDSAYAPYGKKDKEEVIERCIAICDFFIEENVKAIIVACNTATSVAIETLRKRYSIPILGVEPALKLAVEHQPKQNIVVMATSLTLKEKKFSDLLHRYAQNNQIIKMPCPDFVDIVEHNLPNKQELVNKQINQYSDILKKQKIDVVVLGCTHFVFLKKYIMNYFQNDILVVDGNLGVAHNLQRILLDYKAIGTQSERIDIFNSLEDEEIIDRTRQLICL